MVRRSAAARVRAAAARAAGRRRRRERRRFDLQLSDALLAVLVERTLLDFVFQLVQLAQRLCAQVHKPARAPRAAIAAAIAAAHQPGELVARLLVLGGDGVDLLLRRRLLRRRNDVCGAPARVSAERAVRSRCPLGIALRRAAPRRAATHCA